MLLTTIPQVVTPTFFAGVAKRSLDDCTAAIRAALEETKKDVNCIQRAATSE